MLIFENHDLLSVIPMSSFPENNLIFYRQNQPTWPHSSLLYLANVTKLLFIIDKDCVIIEA